MKRPRRLSSSNFIALGGVLLFAGLIAFWGRVALYDADGFAGRAIEVLESDAVRTVVTREIVDQIVQHGSTQLVTVRPVLEIAVGQVVETRPFVAIYGNAIRQAHASLFGGHDTVVLQLLDVMIVVDAAVRAVDPDLSEQLPDMQSTLVELQERDFATRAITIGRRVRFLGWLLPLLALLAFAAGVWGDSDRNRAVSRIGFAWAAAGTAVLATVGVGRAFLMTYDIDPLMRRAMLGVWHPFAVDLAIWAAVLAVLGVALAAAASSAFRPVDVRADFDRCRRILAWAPTTRPRRLARAAAILLAAFVMLRWPGFVAAGLVVGVGLYGLYLGLNELIRVSGLGSSEAGGRDPSRAGSRVSRRAAGRRALRFGLVTGILVVGLSVGGWLFFTGGEGGVSQVTGDELVCNGHAELCDRRLNEIAIPASHNAMSAAAEQGWFFASHQGGLKAQLEYGIRGFLIDTYYGIAVDRGVRTSPVHRRSRQTLIDEFDIEFVEAVDRLAARMGRVEEDSRAEIYMCHVVCEAGATRLADALATIRTFLERHPTEIVVIFVQDETRVDDTAAVFENTGLVELALVHEPGEPWPTLREMIESNRRLLVMTESGASGPAWLHRGFDVIQETPYSFKSAGEFNCAANRGQPDSPMFLLNHWIEKVTPFPADADSVNAYDFLLRRAMECQMERGRIPNLVAVNFYDHGDVLAVVDALNGISAAPPRRGT